MKNEQKLFFAPPSPYGDFERAHFVIASVPVEGTVSYGAGTANGPQALLAASQQVELFDVDEQTEPYRAGIATLPIPPAISSAAEGVRIAGEATKKILENGKIPVILGGEHSLTVGALREIAKVHGDFSILHFDAHGDLRDTYHGDTYSHASALRRCIELPEVQELVQVGIRNVSNDPSDGNEFDFMQDNKDRIAIYYAKDMPRWDIDAMVNQLSERVFITFDVDAFDSSVMPATGTPEPGGLDWYTTIEILKRVSSRKSIIGMDFVEFAPLQGFRAPDFLVAKLIYKTIGFVASRNGWL